jgi:phosphate uptake regulator
MQIRKLVKAGSASFTLSLPKEWIEKNKLNKGDSLYITEKSHNQLIITTELKEEKPFVKEITIVTDNKELETIRREITSAYINNYSTIIIIGKDLNSKVMEIRRYLHDFVALEIEEQTGDKITAKDLLNLKEISIEKTVRRMDMILRSMIQDSLKGIYDTKLCKGISYRDFDINRFYFLILRLIKSSLKDPKVALNFKISNAEALKYWNLIVNLEEMGDSVKTLCQHFPNTKEKKELHTIYDEIFQEYLSAMKSYYASDKVLADKVSSARTNILKNLNEYVRKNNSVEKVEMTTLLKELETYICNIARIVIDD